MRCFTESPAPSAGDVTGGTGAVGWTATGVGAGAGASVVFGEARSTASQVRPLFVHEPNHMRQGRIVAQLAVLVARNVVDLADGREHFCLLDGVHAEIGFQIEIDIQHVLRIAGLLDHQGKDAFLHRFASAVR